MFSLRSSQLQLLPLIIWGLLVVLLLRSPLSAAPLRVGCAIPAIGSIIAAIAAEWQYQHAQQAAPQRVEIITLSDGNDDPHFFHLKPQTIQKFKHLALYISVGLELEKPLLPKIRALNPQIRIVSFYNEQNNAIIHDAEYTHVDTHALNLNNHDQTHEPPTELPQHEVHQAAANNVPPASFHPWLAPSSLRQLAELVAKALSAEQPAHAQLYQNKLSEYQTRIAKLDKFIVQTINHAEEKTLFTLHPLLIELEYVYAPLALKVISLSKDDHIAPTPSQLKRFTTALSHATHKFVITTPHDSQYFSGLQSQLAPTVAASLSHLQVNPTGTSGIATLDKIFTAFAKLQLP